MLPPLHLSFHLCESSPNLLLRVSSCSRAHRSVAIAILGLVASFGVELSQTISAPWLDDLRATTLGALLLGRGFLWSDLAAYTVGAALALAIDLIAVRRIPQRDP